MSAERPIVFELDRERKCAFASCKEDSDLRQYKQTLMCGDHVRLQLQIDGHVYSGKINASIRPTIT